MKDAVRLHNHYHGLLAYACMGANVPRMSGMVRDGLA